MSESLHDVLVFEVALLSECLDACLVVTWLHAWLHVYMVCMCCHTTATKRYLNT
jgi:hypothetical protein